MSEKPSSAVRSRRARDGVCLVVLALLAVSLVAVMALLAILFVALPGAGCEPAPGTDGSPRDGRGRIVLTVAYTPEKSGLFERLTAEFNQSNSRYSIRAIGLEMDEMVDRALMGEFVVISPDSAIWLDPLDRAWHAQNPDRSNLVGSLSRYALSPVVIAAYETTAISLGYPGQSIGWADLMERAVVDRSFRWGRPSTSTAAGLLTTTAEFYAALGKTSNLSREDLANPSAQEYVRRIEETIQQYGGETEDKVLARLLGSETRALDAFVSQEQLVVRHNALTGGERLIAIYPREGTLWMDHPLVLLETGRVTSEQRRGFQEMVALFRSPSMQQIVLEEGYRPADLRISLDDPSSQIRLEKGVDPSQPYTMLQMPSPSVIASIRDLWVILKRPANIYLVVDTSGSMDGQKLQQAKEALRSFVRQVQGSSDRVALSEFYDSVDELVPLGNISENRLALEAAIDGLVAGGNTALHDAILQAVTSLQAEGDFERINAVLVMTDGRENASDRAIRGRAGDAGPLVAVLQEQLKQGAVPVMVFTVAYGDDADLRALAQISQATGGYSFKGEPETIRKLYQLLAAFF